VVGLSSCSLLYASGCAGKGSVGFPIDALEREIRYCGEYREYLRLAGPKAWAVAGDAEGIFVSGLSYDDDSSETPELRACQFCEGRRRDRRIDAPCVLHARGDCATERSGLRYCPDLPGGGEHCADALDAGGVKCPPDAGGQRLGSGFPTSP
jgi:hypothetical protein